MKSIEHQMAGIALECIMRTEQDSKNAIAYGRVCHLFPSLLLLNGLSLTTLFFRSKDKQSEQYLLDLGRAIGHVKLEEGSIKCMSFSEYQALSLKALRAATWFKRYAEAILKVTSSEERGE